MSVYRNNAGNDDQYFLNLMRWQQQADAQTLRYDAGDAFAGKTLPDRVQIIVDAYLSLRAASFTTAVPSEVWEPMVAENARLKAEVERLWKAGDAMAKVVIPSYTREVKEKAIAEWIAAKEVNP